MIKAIMVHMLGAGNRPEFTLNFEVLPRVGEKIYISKVLVPEEFFRPCVDNDDIAACLDGLGHTNVKDAMHVSVSEVEHFFDVNGCHFVEIGFDIQEYKNGTSDQDWLNANELTRNKG